MSTRSSRKKRAPPKLSEPEESDTPRTSRSARKPIQKPKYATDASNDRGSPTPRSSRHSSPASRPSTPAKSAKRGRKSTSSAGRRKKGPSGTATPISRQSRASSVASTAKASMKKSSKKPKIKTKLGRGYNPNLVNYKDSEYHYGSDFDEAEFDPDDSNKSSDSDLSDMESISDSMKPESDVELEPNLLDEDLLAPDPFWLQESSDIPALELPPSSDDLPLPTDQAMKAIAVYEVLRQFFKILRLSPFRFEDFCIALKIEDEQPNILSEIHISLLKALIREDDNLQTQYGPLDQKDSMNLFLYFIDSITWPENLRFYLSSDPVYNAGALDVLATCEYPFTNVENRLKVLKQLTDILLSTSAVRDDLLNEGSLPLEDHCRVCHRLGDMVVCEHCNGPFHGTCLEPPLYEVPDEDWICPVCVNNMVEGVYDCLPTTPGSCRIQSLGVDRHGSRYWFACRRLWVEARDGQSRYYSTRAQLTEVLEVLDSDLYEKDLYSDIIGQQEEIEQCMDVSERLTKEKNLGLKKSYLDMDNAVLEKLQQERSDLREHQESESRKIQEDIDRQIREEDEERRKEEKERLRKEKAEKLEKIRKEREERQKRREESRGEGSVSEEELKQEEEAEAAEIEKMEAEIKEEEVPIETETVPAPPKPTFNGPWELKRGTIPTGVYYRLGEENTYKSYVNQYSVHHHALSRIQAKEEGEKRSRLSHKFSLTDAASFKWSGSLVGSRNHLTATIRQTILKLEDSIPIAFMHTNWSLLRKPWIQAVTNCNNPSKDFSRALTVMTSCIKSCIMLPVWSENLGHTMVKKHNYQGKEEKKKAERREKKEREDEEERLRPYMTWVKYTLPVRSLSVVRQKGEEYRAHGRNGWLWLSNTRVHSPKSAFTQGLMAGPYRIAVKYTELHNNTSKVVLMDPKAFKYLMEVQKERDDKALARAVAGEPEPGKQDEVIDVEKSEEEKRKDSLTALLDKSRLDIQEAKEEDLGGCDGVVDVSGGIVNPTRLLYPRASKKCKLDDLLARRVQLKNVEEKRYELEGSKVNTELEKDTKTTLTSDIVTEAALKGVEAWIFESKEQINVIIDRLELTAVPCYSPLCQLENQSISLPCYSPLCGKGDIPSALLEATRVYVAINKECKRREIHDNSVEEDFKFETIAAAKVALEELRKQLTVKEEEEADNPSAMQPVSIPSSSSITDAANPEIKTEDVKPESLLLKQESDPEVKTEAAQELIYSHVDTSRPLYLKRIQTLAESKRPSRIVKYPLAPTFYSKVHDRRNILISSRHDLKKLARAGGLTCMEGYNYASKANQGVWPYPCPRPTFKTAWLYRTAGMASLHSVAMQLRIIWMCLRWDDMNTKAPSNTEGKNQVTTDNEIVTTEILKHQNNGRFLENTQYFQRKVVIPLDQPRKQIDYSPIRSGLRKRKRVESPVQAEPQVEEKWIEEGELELWDIRNYRDRIDRERNTPATRRQAGTSIKAPEKYDPSEDVKRRTTNNDIKSKIDATIKEQREAFKASRSTTPDLPNSKPSLAGFGLRKNDSSIKIVASNAPASSYTPTTIPGAKKIFISRDGKIIGHQLSTQPAATPPGKIAIAPVSAARPTLPPAVTSSPGAQQKVQIVKTADGKIQVRGLQPGQQLVQMPDGKLQIFSNPPSGASPGIKLANSGKVLGTAPLPLATTTTPQPQQPLQQQLLPKPVIQPSTPVLQNSKTYTIQRPPSIVNQVQPNLTPIQIQPKPSVTGIIPNVAPRPLLPATPVNTPGVIQSPGGASMSPAKANALVGIQSLGQNTVTIQDGQLIVQGPDHEAATAIARQLASGQAKLANLGGKQVLLITNPNQKTESPAQVSQQQPQQQLQQLQQTTSAPQQQVINNQQLPQITSPQQQVVNPQQVLQQQLPIVSQQQQPAVSQQQQPAVSQLQQQLTSPLRQQQQLPEQPSQQQQPLATNPTSITVTAQLVQTAQGPRIILQGLQGVNLAQDQLMSIQQQVKTQLLKQQALARQQGKVPPTKVTLELMLSSVAAASSPSAPRPLPPATNSPALPGGSSMPNTPQQQDRVENTRHPSTASQPPENKPKVHTVNNLPEHVIKQGKYVIRDGKKILVLPPHVMQQYKDSLKQPQTPQIQNPQDQLQLSPLGGTGGAGDDKFELTDDYIQATIKEALQSGNLAPDLEEKLMNQLDEEEAFKLKGKGGKKGRKREPVYDPSSGERMDDEWEPQPWTKNKINNQIKETKEKIPDFEPPGLVIQPPAAAAASGLKPKTKVRAPVTPAAASPQVKMTANKLSSMLFKYKEQLKKDIAKKRSQLEKELSAEINKDVDSLKKQAALKLGVENAAISARKRKSADLSHVAPTASPPLQQPAKKRRKSEKKETEDKISKGRQYCVCKTPYDEKKFYVGCDVCSNWFHGACVGITPKMSKRLTEYICDECTNAKEGTEVYCLCQQPYDESRFYIGCEKCPEWFHGRCVGILQAEAEGIEKFECPRCNPDSRFNLANLSKLRLQDLEHVKKLFKQILGCKHSLPFRKPVDKKTNKKYYDVVKEPMDLETVEKKLNRGAYVLLADFLGDITRIVENCRYYNPPGTPVSKTAENLETFVVQKVAILREKLLAKK